MSIVKLIILYLYFSISLANVCNANDEKLIFLHEQGSIVGYVSGSKVFISPEFVNINSNAQKGTQILRNSEKIIGYLIMIPTEYVLKSIDDQVRILSKNKNITLEIKSKISDYQVLSKTISFNYSTGVISKTSVLVAAKTESELFSYIKYTIIKIKKILTTEYLNAIKNENIELAASLENKILKYEALETKILKNKTSSLELVRLIKSDINSNLNKINNIHSTYTLNDLECINIAVNWIYGYATHEFKKQNISINNCSYLRSKVMLELLR